MKSSRLSCVDACLLIILRNTKNKFDDNRHNLLFLTLSLHFFLLLKTASPLFNQWEVCKVLDDYSKCCIIGNWMCFSLLKMFSPLIQEAFSNLTNWMGVLNSVPTVGHLKHSGRLRWVWEQICLVCSAALESFGTVWTASAPIQLWLFWLVVC